MPKSNWELVQLLGQSVYGHGTDMMAVTEAIRKVIETEAWQQFTDPMGKEHTWTDFATFLVTKPLAGIGAESVEQVRRLVGDDLGTLNKMDELLQRPNGVHALDNIQGNAPTGTSQGAALRRLRKDRPDLLKRVIDKELTPHAAMVEAGFRQKTITVPADAAGAARRLARYFDLRELEEAWPK